MTYRLHVDRMQCSGRSCRRCEEYLPGFFERHGGVLLVSGTVMADDCRADLINGAVEECPQQCLHLEPINGGDDG